MPIPAPQGAGTGAGKGGAKGAPALPQGGGKGAGPGKPGFTSNTSAAPGKAKGKDKGKSDKGKGHKGKGKPKGHRSNPYGVDDATQEFINHLEERNRLLEQQNSWMADYVPQDVTPPKHLCMPLRFNVFGPLTSPGKGAAPAGPQPAANAAAAAAASVAINILRESGAAAGPGEPQGAAPNTPPDSSPVSPPDQEANQQDSGGVWDPTTTTPNPGEAVAKATRVSAPRPLEELFPPGKVRPVVRVLGMPAVAADASGSAKASPKAKAARADVPTPDPNMYRDTDPRTLNASPTIWAKWPYDPPAVPPSDGQPFWFGMSVAMLLKDFGNLVFRSCDFVEEMFRLRSMVPESPDKQSLDIPPSSTNLVDMSETADLVDIPPSLQIGFAPRYTWQSATVEYVGDPRAYAPAYPHKCCPPVSAPVCISSHSLEQGLWCVFTGGNKSRKKKGGRRPFKWVPLPPAVQQVCWEALTSHNCLDPPTRSATITYLKADGGRTTEEDMYVLDFVTHKQISVKHGTERQIKRLMWSDMYNLNESLASASGNPDVGDLPRLNAVWADLTTQASGSAPADPWSALAQSASRIVTDAGADASVQSPAASSANATMPEPLQDPSGDHEGLEICSISNEEFMSHFQEWNGKHYPMKKCFPQSWAKEVNLHNSLEDMQEYSLSNFAQPVPPQRDISQEPVFTDGYEFVATLRATALNGHASGFWYPACNDQFDKILGTSIEALVPGRHVSIRNAMPPPAWMTDGSKGRILTGFHGTTTSGMLQMCATGPAAQWGAGQDALIKVYGVPILGSYLSMYLEGAWKYPDAVRCPASRYFRGPDQPPVKPGHSQAAGIYLTQSGTVPVHLVAVFCFPETALLWQRIPYQGLVRNDEIYIQNLTLWGTSPALGNTLQRSIAHIGIPILTEDWVKIRDATLFYNDAVLGLLNRFPWQDDAGNRVVTPEGSAMPSWHTKANGEEHNSNEQFLSVALPRRIAAKFFKLIYGAEFTSEACCPWLRVREPRTAEERDSGDPWIVEDVKFPNGNWEPYHGNRSAFMRLVNHEIPNILLGEIPLNKFNEVYPTLFNIPHDADRPHYVERANLWQAVLCEAAKHGCTVHLWESTFKSMPFRNAIESRPDRNTFGLGNPVRGLAQLLIDGLDAADTMMGTKGAAATLAEGAGSDETAAAQRSRRRPVRKKLTAYDPNASQEENQARADLRTKVTEQKCTRWLYKAQEVTKRSVPDCDNAFKGLLDLDALPRKENGQRILLPFHFPEPGVDPVIAARNRERARTGTLPAAPMSPIRHRDTTEARYHYHDALADARALKWVPYLNWDMPVPLATFKTMEAAKHFPIAGGLPADERVTTVVAGCLSALLEAGHIPPKHNDESQPMPDLYDMGKSLGIKVLRHVLKKVAGTEFSRAHTLLRETETDPRGILSYDNFPKTFRFSITNRAELVNLYRMLADGADPPESREASTLALSMFRWYPDASTMVRRCFSSAAALRRHLEAHLESITFLTEGAVRREEVNVDDILNCDPDGNAIVIVPNDDGESCQFNIFGEWFSGPASIAADLEPDRKAEADLSVQQWLNQTEFIEDDFKPDMPPLPEGWAVALKSDSTPLYWPVADPNAVQFNFPLPPEFFGTSRIDCSTWFDLEREQQENRLALRDASAAPTPSNEGEADASAGPAVPPEDVPMAQAVDPPAGAVSTAVPVTTSESDQVMTEEAPAGDVGGAAAGSNETATVPPQPTEPAEEPPTGGDRADGAVFADDGAGSEAPVSSSTTYSRVASDSSSFTYERDPDSHNHFMLED